ncbi:insulinase family protein [Alteromonas aestuariivivens]|uniref:insulinase family protein n=1 Tax=Alteromonas aestuariivivens TaxID=1938339 RepID=UPI001FE9031F|nr:insulinase family protein [Alteromonas aestuariivivens]
MTTSLNLDKSLFFTLPNGLRVMVCQQRSWQTCYVSMSVKAGHFYDPEDCQGLSHLLEHAMFLGSRHLPKPNSINTLVEQCGGTINAWTGTEYANYHFDCQSDALTKLLPAFADMLRTPLMDKAAIRKEIQSIDAEFQFKLKDDLRRLYQIHKETCNPEHPFSKFSVGSGEIFNSHTMDELHQRLQSFHSQYYCGRNMALCIATPFAPSRIKELVAQSFNMLRAGAQAAAEWPALYLPEQLGIQINIVPLQTARRMIVTFALPGLHNDYRTKPLNYLSHLLGDEGEGSLLAYLKSCNWVTNLIAGSGIEGDDFKDFNVSFQLTPTGLNRRFEILNALFAYIDIIKVGVLEPWRYQEKARLAMLATEFDDNPKPLSAACEYAQHLFSYSFEEIPLLHATVEDYDLHSIERALSYFVPQNIRVKTIAPNLPTDRKCRYYDAHYQVAPLPAEMLEALATPEPITALSLPPPNPYLSDDYHLTLPERGFDQPKLIDSSRGLRTWFAQDHQFHSPKGDIYISFDTEAFSVGLQATAAKRIWLAALNDHLQEKYYRADIAGLHYRIYGHQAGFTLHTRGFSNQQTTLAMQLLHSILTFEPGEENFERLKGIQAQGLHNSLMNKPTNRLFSRLSVLIQRNTQAPVELLKAVQDCSLDTVQTLRKQAFGRYFVEAFMHGNWSSEEAIQFARTLNTTCRNATGAPLSRSVTRLPAGVRLFHEVTCEHDDAAVVFYLQAPGSTLQDTALCMVLDQILAAPFFNVLRTEKQLGYVVGTGFVPHNQHPGVTFYVQSPTTSATELLNADYFVSQSASSGTGFLPFLLDKYSAKPA